MRSIILILGAPGMGKTSLAVNLVRRYPGQVKIVDPGSEFAERGFREQSVWPGREKADEWCRELTANGEGPSGGGWGPGLLVLDDLDRYVPKGSDRNNPWADIWVANRHVGLDVIAISHRPARVPLDLIESASVLWLFSTTEPNAVDYLAKDANLAPYFQDGRNPIPTEPGVALKIVKVTKSVDRVRIFTAPKAQGESNGQRDGSEPDRGVDGAGREGGGISGTVGAGSERSAGVGAVGERISERGDGSGGGSEGQRDAGGGNGARISPSVESDPTIGGNPGPDEPAERATKGTRAPRQSGRKLQAKRRKLHRRRSV